jgi:flavin reductase (DIM6/NTAB) family NADH-FMN oxidoreductase RutF
MGHFVTGVTVITAMVEGRPLGMTAQSFVSLSLDPPLVMVCPSRYSSTWRLMEETGVLCINVLSSGQEAISRRFAAKTDERFQEVNWGPAPTTGSPLLEGVHAWVDCSIEDVHPGGDHLIAVCRVLALGAPDERGNPLVFYTGRYGEVAVDDPPKPGS